MEITRRTVLKGIGAGMLASGFLTALQQTHAAEGPAGVKVGMCDWNLGGSCNPELIPKAKEAHLDGIQVSVGLNANNIPLRKPEVRDRYLALGKEYGIEFCSVAAGGILNAIPLASEPQSAMYVLDAIEAAKALGSSCTLLAFFGEGDLRLPYPGGYYGTGEGYRNIRKDPVWKEWELDTLKVRRLVDFLRQIVPRAEDAGVILGLENTLSAAQNLDIIDRAGGSPMIQVYYDVGNSTGGGYDVPAEIHLLGKDRICEVHLKDSKTRVFGVPDAQVDMAACAKAFKEIGYSKWYVLETSGRDKQFLPDTQANVAFTKKLFG
ncbi:MAG TPA: sugar phosphate isomerase/epimerase family protein [bacterium]|nr:sugar phosphate isomerase/epimerase family protein [bacterium]HQL61417.1 sugar phosphate isomerase/epimerase family protein [bacterium]